MERTNVSFEQVIAVLESLASKKRTITYNDLAATLGLAPVNNLFANSALSLFFEQIDWDDAEEQRPFRTAVVVLKGTGRPGSGFYRSIEHHRQILIQEAEEAVVWQLERSALEKYYDASRPHVTLQIRVSHAQAQRLSRLSTQISRTQAQVIEGGLTGLLAHLEREVATMEAARNGPFIESEEVLTVLQEKRGARA